VTGDRRWPIPSALCYHSPSRPGQATLARAFLSLHHIETEILDLG